MAKKWPDTSTGRVRKYTGGEGTLAPRCFEFKGPCQHCGKPQPYQTSFPDDQGGGQPIVCDNPGCRQVIVTPWPEPPKGQQPAAPAPKPAEPAEPAAMIDRNCKGCGRKYGCPYTPGKPLPACVFCGRVPDEKENADMAAVQAAVGELAKAQQKEAAKKPPSKTAQILEQLPRVATAGECGKCKRAIWWWKTTNKKGEAVNICFDHKPAEVVGIKFGPDNETVVGLERRTCFINHFITCPNAADFRK